MISFLRAENVSNLAQVSFLVVGVLARCHLATLQICICCFTFHTYRPCGVTVLPHVPFIHPTNLLTQKC